MIDLTDLTKQINDMSSMPSNSYEDIELLESGSEYQAPADGWFTTMGVINEIGKFIAYSNETNGKMYNFCRATTVGMSGSMFLPVKKDDIVKFYYTTTYTPTFFGFLYAEGSL